MSGTQGERVKQLRKHLRLNQQDFADRIEVTQGAISQIENSGNASLEILIKISNAYNSNLDWLAEGKGEMFSKSQEKSAQPTLSSEKFWQEMAMKQMKTIADLVSNNQKLTDSVSLLTAEISSMIQSAKPVKQQ